MGAAGVVDVVVVEGGTPLGEASTVLGMEASDVVVVDGTPLGEGITVLWLVEEEEGTEAVVPGVGTTATASSSEAVGCSEIGAGGEVVEEGEEEGGAGSAAGGELSGRAGLASCRSDEVPAGFEDASSLVDALADELRSF